MAVRQKLLNHFQDLERRTIIYGAQQQVPAVMDHLFSSEGRLTRSARQELKVGNHIVVLEFDKDRTGITEGSFRNTSSAPKASNDDSSPISWIVGLLVMILILFLFIG